MISKTGQKKTQIRVVPWLFTQRNGWLYLEEWHSLVKYVNSFRTIKIKDAGVRSGIDVYSEV